jgi:SAM-dependent methyltransferase
MRSARRLADLALDRRDPEYLLKEATFAHVAEARLYARGRLLDVGCGNRPYLEVFAPSVSSYVGVDPDRRGSKPDVAALAGDLPFAERSFDAALSFFVIEHVPDPGRMLAEIRRVLRPGAHLILLAPQYWRLHEEPHDFFRFTHYGLAHLAREQGFEVVDIRAQGGAWRLAGQVLANALQVRPRLRRLIPLVNLAFAFFDCRRPDPGDTISYLLIARRPEAS